jgi:hypothetical protein
MTKTVLYKLKSKVTNLAFFESVAGAMRLPQDIQLLPPSNE